MSVTELPHIVLEEIPPNWFGRNLYMDKLTSDIHVDIDWEENQATCQIFILLNIEYMKILSIQHDSVQEKTKCQTNMNIAMS